MEKKSSPKKEVISIGDRMSYLDNKSIEWASYDDITCLSIEIGLHQFYKSNFDPKRRYIEINSSFKVDMKDWVEIDNDD